MSEFASYWDEDAVDRGILVPFQYFGVHDETDYGPGYTGDMDVGIRRIQA